MKVFVISDSTGETGELLVEAAIVQFEDVEFNISRYGNVLTKSRLQKILDTATDSKCEAIVYSFVDDEMIDLIESHCVDYDMVSIDILSPLIRAFEYLSQTEASDKPGALRRMDEKYFERVSAVEFAVRYDDGKDPRGILLADIVIIGISRTSKTPLSMYLAQRNYKVCNIPLVPETSVPKELFEINPSKIIGLTNSPEKLNQIRRERVRALGISSSNSNYCDYDRIFEELEYAYTVFDQLGCPVYDVADRAIEETAELIINHLRKF